MSEIPIGSRGQYTAIVDADDYPWLSQWRWTFKRSSWAYGANIYARRCVWREGLKVTLLMHLEILEHRKGLKRPSERHTGDHRNKNTLDNTRRNLRWATESVQNSNQRPRITSQEVADYAACAGEEIPF
jgi:hypothetical protein